MSHLDEAFKWFAFAVLVMLMVRHFAKDFILAIREAYAKDVNAEDDEDEYLTAEEEEFLDLSREMYRHSRGTTFEEAMKTFPSEKFHRWCNLGSQI
jgi:hypothetical protein